MTDQELIAGLEKMRDTLIAVAVGGPRINEVNDEYQRTWALVDAALKERRIAHSITYKSLWEWYERWRSGDLPTYQSRRIFVTELIAPITDALLRGAYDQSLPTGWTRVDRAVGEARDRLASAATEEQLQAVGLICREICISVAQAVYVPDKHPSLDGIAPSRTDAKRILECYIAAELAGGANEETRRHARSALELANALTHRRTAVFREAAMCVEATTSVVNVIAIVAGRRDP